jgi:hypothetical protein
MKNHAMFFSAIAALFICQACGADVLSLNFHDTLPARTSYAFKCQLGADDTLPQYLDFAAQNPGTRVDERALAEMDGSCALDSSDSWLNVYTACFSIIYNMAEARTRLTNQRIVHVLFNLKGRAVSSNPDSSCLLAFSFPRWGHGMGIMPGKSPLNIDYHDTLTKTSHRIVPIEWFYLEGGGAHFQNEMLIQPQIQFGRVAGTFELDYAELILVSESGTAVTIQPRMGPPMGIAVRPENGGAVVDYGVDRPGAVNIDIFSVSGLLLWRANASASQSGRVFWDGTNQTGARAMPGTYLIRVGAGQDTKVLPVLLK